VPRRRRRLGNRRGADGTWSILVRSTSLAALIRGVAGTDDTALGDLGPQGRSSPRDPPREPGSAPPLPLVRIAVDLVGGFPHLLPCHEFAMLAQFPRRIHRDDRLPEWSEIMSDVANALGQEMDSNIEGSVDIPPPADVRRRYVVPGIGAWDAGDLLDLGRTSVASDERM
jgi:hypothetical protein